MLPGLKYLNNMEGILLRFRVANTIALGDIKNCYHKILSGPRDASLRRIFIKPNGMGSESEWREGCFGTVSFGDVEKEQLHKQPFQTVARDLFHLQHEFFFKILYIYG